MGQSFTNCMKSFPCCYGNEEKHKVEKRPKTIKKLGALESGQWEDNDNVTPSQISDDMLTRQIKSDLGVRQINNELKFDQKVLEKEGYTVMDKDFIGKGCAGIVYKVKQTIGGDIYAAKVSILLREKGIKKLSRHKFMSFRNEVFVLRKHPHKNIIRLKEHFLCDQSISFIIMEFANTGSLESRQRDYGKRFDEKTSKHYLVQIANAVSYLHSKGTVHGDLKLANVLIQKNGGKECIKVTDFGCSQVVFKKDTGTVMKSKVVGTLSYMSPEQIIIYIHHNLGRHDLVKGIIRRYDPFKADCWALGVCLYRLVHYTRPFNYTDKIDPMDMFQMYGSMKSGFKIEKTIYKELSNECVELMKGLMEFDRYKRIDTKIVMSTTWIIESDQYDPIGDKI